MQELWTGVKTKIPRGTNKSLWGPQLLKWLQRIIAESYNRTESMPFSPGNKKKRKKKSTAALITLFWKTGCFPLPSPSSKVNCKPLEICPERLWCIWKPEAYEIIYLLVPWQITSERRGKRDSALQSLLACLGSLKGAIQLCHCCQAFKTVYIHDRGIYLILITSLRALPALLWHANLLPLNRN